MSPCSIDKWIWRYHVFPNDGNPRPLNLRAVPYRVYENTKKKPQEEQKRQNERKEKRDPCTASRMPEAVIYFSTTVDCAQSPVRTEITLAVSAPVSSASRTLMFAHRMVYRIAGD